MSPTARLVSPWNTRSSRLLASSISSGQRNSCATNSISSTGTSPCPNPPSARLENVSPTLSRKHGFRPLTSLNRSTTPKNADSASRSPNPANRMREELPINISSNSTAAEFSIRKPSRNIYPQHQSQNARTQLLPPVLQRPRLAYSDRTHCQSIVPHHLQNGLHQPPSRLHLGTD